MAEFRAAAPEPPQRQEQVAFRVRCASRDAPCTVVLTTSDACFAAGLDSSVAIDLRAMSRQMCAVRCEVTQIGRPCRTSAREPVKYALLRVSS